jgi:hypothetical protein
MNDETAKQKAEDDVREALFRYMFEHNRSVLQQHAKAYYLGVVGTGGKITDPSDGFMARFIGHEPPVKKQSAAVLDRDSGYIKDSVTGEHAIIFAIATIDWIADAIAVVHGHHREGDLMAAYYTYSLQKRDRGWTVIWVELALVE